MTSDAPPPSSPTEPPRVRPWLSVLIPVYNVEDYLRECLASVLSQADQGVEVLMVDDCSTDGSGQLMCELAARDARARCLFHTQNLGLSGARNTLLQAAQGEYVWFLDSDDFLTPGAIDSLRGIVQAQAPSLVLCDFRMVRERMKARHRWRGHLHMHTFHGPARELLNDTSLLVQGLFEAGQLHSWSKIAKRSVWGEQLRFPVGRYFEDMATTPLLALAASTFWYEPEVWIGYRQREGSILHTPNLKKAEHLAHALANLREAAVRSSLTDAALFAWAHFTARNFIGAARMATKAQPDRCGGLITHYRQAFEEASPISLRELKFTYLRRGWWIRALRLRRWLREADCGSLGHQAPAQSDSSMSS
ncbi:hypothetical protein CDN99_11805 [Roseateles aquatilis]|uniref:Glycosyltransferase 2-like domain-containing protein n=1 Tax=Roseateles aquatilis TaxID=431061 RepID=A0A246JE52_9BURK|nr:glycosyltransferase family 2 protein [Roseateles aquatilis]OWQ90841.1 hypothetical protein CDN99_11805 [Roseateles aquatilis]